MGTDEWPKAADSPLTLFEDIFDLKASLKMFSPKKNVHLDG